MKRFLNLFLSICVLMLLPCCAREVPREPGPREPDPRDISPEDVAYIISSTAHSPTVAIEDRELIAEFTDSVNGLRSELGVYDDKPRSHTYPHFAFDGPEEDEYKGHVVLFGESGEELAHADFYGSKVHRDNYCYSGQRSILFDLDRLDSIGNDMPDGVSPITTLWFECMWGAEKVWVEDTRTGETAVTSDKELIDRLYDHFTALNFRVDEPCGEDNSWRFRVRWIYLETDELLEHVEIWYDGRIQRDGHWCTPLNGPIDTGLLMELFDNSDK